MAPIVKTLLLYIKDSQHALEVFCKFNFIDEDKLLSLFLLSLPMVKVSWPSNIFVRTVKESTSKTLLRLAVLMLTLNCFSCGENYNQQTDGVAMGTKLGPNYANFVMISTIAKLTTVSELPPLPERSQLSL